MSGPADHEARRPDDGVRATDRADVLQQVVSAEARRVLGEAQLRPDPARLAAGWERRFITDAGRADELAALYRALGFEVVADPVRAEDLGNDCEDCRLITLLQFRTIYTRRPRSEP